MHHPQDDEEDGEEPPTKRQATQQRAQVGCMAPQAVFTGTVHCVSLMQHDPPSFCLFSRPTHEIGQILVRLVRVTFLLNLFGADSS